MRPEWSKVGILSRQDAPAAADAPVLKPLLQHVPCLAWVLDRDLRITNAVGFRRIWDGLPEDSVLGKSIVELLRIEDPQDAMLRALERAATGESQTILYDFASHSYEVHIDPSPQGFAVVALDVTERKIAEDLLARSETRLKEAQRVAHVGSWEWDVPTNLVEWTDELYRIYGLQRSDFDGTYDGFLSRVPPEEREATDRFLYDAFCRAQPFAYDHLITRPDGAVRKLRTRGDVSTDATGRVVRMSGACWDVTDLWNASQALEETVSVLRGTLESTADGLLVVGLDDRVAAFNQRLCDLWQIPASAVEGQRFHTLLNLVHPQISNADACMQRVQELEGHPEAQSFDTLTFHDGRFFERYSRPQRIADRILGRVWSYRDVSERERLLRRSVFLCEASRLLSTLDAEQALSEVARLSLTLLGDSVAIDLFREGRPVRVLAVSIAAQRITTAAGDGTPGSDKPAFWHDDRGSFLRVPLPGQRDTPGALTFGGPRERIYGDHDASLATELAGRLQLALENARLYREARDALAARDEFLSVAAHELRGPATSLTVAARVLQQEPDREAIQRMIEIIPRSVERISRFLEEILDVTRIRTGAFDLSLAETDFVEVVKEAVSKVRGDAERAGSAVTVAVPAALTGMSDRARLGQAVGNLLDNAIKFGMGRSIEIDLSRDGGDAILIVHDHGIGMAPDALTRLFQPFERGVSSRHYGGLGMGLFIAQTIVNRLGGALTATSREGVGTAFTVRLPLTGTR